MSAWKPKVWTSQYPFRRAWICWARSMMPVPAPEVHPDIRPNRPPGHIALPDHRPHDVGRPGRVGQDPKAPATIAGAGS